MWVQYQFRVFICKVVEWGHFISEINALHIRTNDLQTFAMGPKQRKNLKESFRKSVITDNFVISSATNFFETTFFFMKAIFHIKAEKY